MRREDEAGPDGGGAHCPRRDQWGRGGAVRFPRDLRWFGIPRPDLDAYLHCPGARRPRRDQGAEAEPFSRASRSVYTSITASDPQTEQDLANSLVPGGGAYVTYMIMMRPRALSGGQQSSPSVTGSVRWSPSPTPTTASSSYPDPTKAWWKAR